MRITDWSDGVRQDWSRDVLDELIVLKRRVGIDMSTDYRMYTKTHQKTGKLEQVEALSI